MSLQIIQDGEGNNTGVFIPYTEWSKLKKKHKGDNTALQKAQMELYKKYNVTSDF